MSDATPNPILGITMGDPSGSGPEIVIKALAHEGIYRVSRPVVIGDLATMQAAADICQCQVVVRGLGREALADAGRRFGVVDVLDTANVDAASLVRGRIDPLAGRAAYDCVKKAAHLALEGCTDAIVTSAINKDALNRAGYHYDGHTELLADLCSVKHVAMMLVGGGLRVSHVSTHCSLRDAIDRVKRDRILTVVKLMHDWLLGFGIEEPRIAVAGLNPHAGERGLFGAEEIEEIEPAVGEAQAQGLRVSGPIAADTVFFRMLQGEYEGVVAMYHDQGHIPLKSFRFHEGVNVTLGLPIVRTSVDHGTDFRNAGKGTANPRSLLAALRLAAMMCVRQLH